MLGGTRPDRKRRANNHQRDGSGCSFTTTRTSFLYIDTWDPHEPWDAPDYYTKLYMPDYDGELVHPIYGRWHEMPGYSAELVDKAHATYCGEVTMVDTWVGYLLRMVENMGPETTHGDNLHDRPRLLLRRARRMVR